MAILRRMELTLGRGLLGWLGLILLARTFYGDKIKQGFFPLARRRDAEPVFPDPQIGSAPPQIWVGNGIGRDLESRDFDKTKIFGRRFLYIHGMAKKQANDP